MINKVSPAIRSEWPRANPTDNGGNPKRVVVEVHCDNAPSHFEATDELWMAQSIKAGEVISVDLICQGANLPNTDVSDLGFWA